LHPQHFPYPEEIAKPKKKDERRKEKQSPHKNMPHLQSTVHVEKKMGERLGTGYLLQQAV
jgi:hypothetical protein